jgi:hypothetical protein
MAESFDSPSAAPSEAQQRALNPHRDEDRAHAAEMAYAQLRQRSVNVTGDEPAEELAQLLEAVERFELAVSSVGGDRMTNALDSADPDDRSLVLPVRDDGEATDGPAQRPHGRPELPRGRAQAGELHVVARLAGDDAGHLRVRRGPRERVPHRVGLARRSVHDGEAVHVPHPVLLGGARCPAGRPGGWPRVRRGGRAHPAVGGAEPGVHARAPGDRGRHREPDRVDRGRPGGGPHVERAVGR